MSDEIKYLMTEELRERGILHEMNRQFLHPLGLAAEVECGKPDGSPAVLRIQDWRDDPETVYFGRLDRKKMQSFMRLKISRYKIRKKALGYTVQPTRYPFWGK